MNQREIGGGAQLIMHCSFLHLKWLMKRVRDYLTSDSYMYALLLAPHPATA
ncbi:hypothetical protein MKX01_013055, partial [Papaver californicum]